jgi:uncharacterized membrane protein
MDETEQAHHELDRLQGIVTRHEGHMFALRGWLLAIVGGLLASYYTENIVISGLVLRIALLMVVLLFLIVESRHVNLVEAVVERASALEKRIVDSRQSAGQASVGWYDGPRVSEACQDGANRWWPRRGMTFVLNQPFYLVVILIIILVTVSLPLKRTSAPPQAQAAQPAQK